MKIYIVEAKVEQTVTKDIQLLVEANSNKEAQEKSHQALRDYPEPVKIEGVHRIVTTKSKYWVPKDIEFVKIKKES